MNIPLVSLIRTARPGLCAAALCAGSTAMVSTAAFADPPASACQSSSPVAKTTSTTMDVVATAAKAGNFNTLLAAVEAAGLTSALQAPGPITVFAPTDEAFAKLPSGTVESLLKAENKTKLTSILTYHVVSGNIPSTALATTPAASTLNGQRINFSQQSKHWRVDNATIVATDIACSNGVIHVIDAVIMPVTDTLAEVAGSAGTFNTLLAAAKAAGLVEALRGDKPLTVLAPTDAAFAKLPAGTVESLLKPESRETLKAVLTYHILPGRVYSDQALKAANGTTLQGGDVAFAKRDGAVFANDAKVTSADIDASNGVVHIVDSVLMPPVK